jgi:hypothetical protein
MRIGFPKKIPPPIDQSCVGYWKFDEQTGTLKDYSGNDNHGTAYSTNLNDLSSNGNHGTIYGATRVTGKIGQALSFNGTSDYVDCGNGASLNFGIGDFTIEAWIKTTTDVDGGIFTKKSGAYIDVGNGITIIKDSAVGLRLGIGDGTVGSAYWLDRDSYATNQWIHIAVVVDRIHSIVYRYKNGVKGSEVGTSAITGSLNTAETAKIGKSNDVPWGPFDGLIDDIRVYTRILLQAEITAHYNSGNGLISDPETEIGLVGYWRMGTTDGMTIPGKFGNALKFDGVDDYIYNNTIRNQFTSPSNISLSMWIYPKYFGYDGYGNQIMSFLNGCGAGTNGFELGMNMSGNIVLHSFSNGISRSDWYISTYLSLNNWYHISFVWTDLSPSLSNQAIYKNGILVSQKNIDVNVPPTIPAEFILGYMQQCWLVRYFNGYMDEVRIYNRALSAQEIKRHYMAGR